MFWMSNLYFVIKENWICAMTRNAESNSNNTLLTRWGFRLKLDVQGQGGVKILDVDGQGVGGGGGGVEN